MDIFFEMLLELVFLVVIISVVEIIFVFIILVVVVVIFVLEIINDCLDEFLVVVVSIELYVIFIL